MSTQAYFEDIQRHILRELRQAWRSVYVAVAWFTAAELLDALLEKVRSGVSVEVLILNDEINTGASALDFEPLTNAGGVVHFIGNKDEMMHNKFCVIDAETVITGSYNWTRRAKTNDENITISKGNAALALDFIAEHRRLRRKYVGSGEANAAETLAEVLKRLEILKSTISLQDEDDIAYQSNKLKKGRDGRPAGGAERSTPRFAGRHCRPCLRRRSAADCITAFALPAACPLGRPRAGRPAPGGTGAGPAAFHAGRRARRSGVARPCLWRTAHAGVGQQHPGNPGPEEGAGPRSRRDCARR